MMEKKKKSVLGYFLALLIYVLVALAAIAFLMVWLWGFAEEYEDSRPTGTMNAYVQDLNENLWSDRIAQTITEMPHEFQSDEECAQVVREMLNQGISYARTASGGSADQVNYSLLCGSKVIGKVTLMEDSSKADQVRHGMLPWIVTAEEFDFSGLYSSVEVTVPDNYTVTLNGVELGEEYIVGEPIPFSLLEDYYGSYDQLPVMVTYRADHLFGQMEPVVHDSNGNVFQLDQTRGEEQFLNNCSGEEMERLTDFTERFAERYQYYMAAVGDDPATVYADRLSGYILKGSDLEFRMKAAQDGLFYAHSNNMRVNETTLNSAVSFGGGVYLCDFSSDFTVWGRNGEEDQENHMRMIVVDVRGDMSDLRVAELSKYKNDSEDSQ